MIPTSLSSHPRIVDARPADAPAVFELVGIAGSDLPGGDPGHLSVPDLDGIDHLRRERDRESSDVNVQTAVGQVIVSHLVVPILDLLEHFVILRVIAHQARDFI